MGAGRHTRLVSPKFWEIVEKVPVIIEIIDTSGRIETFLGKISCWLDRLPHGCLVCARSLSAFTLLAVPAPRNRTFPGC